MRAGPGYEFGPFVLDLSGRVLFRGAIRQGLTPKTVDLLIALVEAQGSPMTKSELLLKVWPGISVEEGSLASHVSNLRKAIGEEQIETIPKLGYRFAGSARRFEGREAGSQRIHSLAVLPLKNLSHDPEGDYFAEGMTEALITDLSKLGSLRVVSSTTARRYTGAQKSVREIGRELRVDGVVEGSVQREGGRVRIRVSLAETSLEQNLWAEAYDRDLREILLLQNELASTIAGQIRVQITPEQQLLLAKGRTVRPEAFQSYIRGRYFWVRRTEETVHRAISYFEKALEQDPGYAAAYSGLADCYSSLGFSFDVGSQSPDQVQPKAKAAALKALKLDDSLADAHNSLAYVKLNYEWDWPGAELEFKRALQLNPHYAHAHHWYAHLLLSSGRLEEALSESRQGLELDPLSPILNLHLGWHYLYARQYPLAIEQLTRTIELDSGYRHAYWYRGLALGLSGRYKEALSELQKAKKLLVDSLMVEADLGLIQALAGRPTEAQRTLTRLLNQAKHRYTNPYLLALIYSGLKQSQEAVHWLEQAYRERSDLLVYLKVDPRLDFVRGDRRISELEQKVGVPG